MFLPESPYQDFQLVGDKSPSEIVAKTKTVIIPTLISLQSSYPVERARWIIWFLFDFLQISVMVDALPEDDGVLHQGEEHQHHAGQ